MNQKMTLHGTVKLEKSEEDFFLKLDIDSIEGNSLWVYIPHTKRLKYEDKLKFAHCKMEDGSVWSCLDLVLFSTKASMPGHTILEYDALWAIKNPIAVSVDDVRIYSAAIQLEGLETWLGIYGFYDSMLNTEDNSASAFYKKPDDIILLNIENEVKVIADYHISGNGYFTKKSFPIQQHLDLYFEFNSENKPNLKEATKYINSVINFFNIIWLSHPLKLGYTISLKDSKTGEMFTGEIFYRQRQPKHKLSENFEHYSLLSYKTINNVLPILLENWVALSNQIEPVINIVVEYRLDGNNLTTNSLLNLTQSLETFHRRLRNNDVISKEKFKEKKKRILELLQEEDSSWLKEKLAHMNEPNLGDRITELLNECPESLISLIILDRQKFKKAIADNRNYFTHFDKRYEESNKILGINEMYILNEKIYMILIVLLLKEIGADLDLLVQRMTKNKNRLAALREENMIQF